MRRAAITLFTLFLILAPRIGVPQVRHPYVLSAITVEGAHHLSNETLATLVQTRSGDTLNESVLADDIQRILDAYANRGYAFAKIRPSMIAGADSVHLSLVLHVSEGQDAHIVAIRVAGLRETDTSVVSREFFLGSRPALRRELLEAGALRLRQSGLFTSVSSPELFKVDDSSVGISLNVEEARTTNIDGVLGYAPSSVGGASGYVNGFLDLGFRNIGGSARCARLRYARLTPTTSDLAAGYIEPWFFGIPVDASLSFDRHDEDSIYVSTHVELSAELHSIGWVVLSATAAYDGVTPGSAQIVNPSHILSGGLRLGVDQRDDQIAPHSGYAISLGGSIGSKTTTDTVGFASVASINSLSASGEAAVRLIGARLIGVLGVEAKEVSSVALELSDLFRLGGLTSIRGYREATYSASRYLTLRLEPRFMISDRSYLGAFLDAGWLERVAYASIPDRKWSALGYGISMLFDTQIGYIEGAIALARGVPLDAAVLHLGLKTAL